MANNLPIGVFDSGLGGLTVLKELMNVLSNESFIYFGDTARVPYGSKSPDTVTRYTLENAIFLLEKEIKILVVACNTASAYALSKLRNLFNVPVVGVIEPSAKSAALATKNNKIAVLGTKATIKSKVYPQAIQEFLKDAEVISIPCPMLVPFVEERLFDHPALKMMLESYLEPVIANKADTLLLGCTHYPLIKKSIQECMKGQVQIIDSAQSVAANVKELLINFHLSAQDGPKTKNKLSVYVSDDPERFREIGEELLGFPISQIERADVELKPVTYALRP